MKGSRRWHWRLPDRPLRLQVEAEGFLLGDVRGVQPGAFVHLLTLVPRE